MANAIPNSLQGKRVIVTRAAEQSDSLLQSLRARGAEAISLPLVAFAPADDPAALDAAIQQPRRFDWIFLTSQNALRAIQTRCQYLNFPLANAFEGAQIAAVGPVTAESARTAGLRIDYIAAKHLGAALAEELHPQLPGKRVLLPRSDRANHDIVEILQSSGALVTELVAYKTIRPEQNQLAAFESILRSGADAVLFFSPSAVHHLHDLLGPARFLEFAQKSLFAAVGPVTQNALRRAGVNRIVLAQDTTVASVLDALNDFFAKSGQHAPAGVKLG